MSENEIPEEEAQETPHSPLLDLAALDDAADTRMAAMKANPAHKGNPDLTYAGHVNALLDANTQAISDALHAEAELRVAAAEEKGIGAIAKRKLLASQVLAGQFNA